MKQHDEILVLTDAVLITCIVQRGTADAVVDAATEAGAQGATIFYARGTGVRQKHLGVLSITVNAEKEVIYIVAPADHADHIFERVYVAAQLDTPGMGMIYMTPLEKMATFVPPEVAARFSQQSGQHDNPVLSAPPRSGSYFRVLTCIMPAGHGAEVLEALRSEAGVISAFAHHARGIGTRNLRHRVFAEEKQVLTALVEAERADEVFHFLYYRAGLDSPHAGMIMMGRAVRGAGVVALPETGGKPA